MLHFQEHRWLLKHGASRFSVIIGSTHRRPEDVIWELEATWIAGGAAWRRVQDWKRPEVELEVSSFKLPGPKWTSLEHVNYWDGDDEGEDLGPLSWLFTRAGTVDISYRPRPHPEPPQRTSFGEVFWRVARREGSRFIVELTCVANGRNLRKKLEAQEVKVLPDGTEERAEPDAAFWKANSQLYMLEEIPFGVIHVTVPRNVKDVEAHAIRRARELTGAPEPEHIRIMDQLSEENVAGGLWNDIRLELQYHGYYEN